MTLSVAPRTIVPNASFRQQVERQSGEKISACFQCEKCTNGCPVTFAMDILPHQLIRYVHLGLKEEVLKSDTIWVCASCETCNTRCPNGIGIAHIMDTLRQMSRREGMVTAQKSVPLFHQAFLSSVKRYGRVHELEMLVNYILQSEGLRGLIKQSGKGLRMFSKGKLKVLPAKLRAGPPVRKAFEEAARKD